MKCGSLLSIESDLLCWEQTVYAAISGSLQSHTVAFTTY